MSDNKSAEQESGIKELQMRMRWDSHMKDCSTGSDSVVVAVL